MTMRLFPLVGLFNDSSSNLLLADLAQSVEQRTVNPLVESSNLSISVKIFNNTNVKQIIKKVISE